MIRINLLTVERERSKKKSSGGGAGFGVAQKLTLACSLILAGTGLFIGWRWVALNADSKSVDDSIAAAQTEAGRLHSIILQVQQFEQRKAQLSQRVTLIEQLRKGQTGPVHMLDQLSRSLPPMLWLTEVKQGAGGEVVVDGRCTTLTSLSDFVANLESTGYFKKSIEIISSQTETVASAPGDLIRFSIRAVFQQPGDSPAVPASVAAVRQASAPAPAAR